MRVNKLRLSGFKSFVDATELVIQPGLTGVIGPNGCGKSNLVEALRWVMGETSPKSMRGDAMDDTIFGGSANRPARDSAEVVLALDNAERDAPAAYNDSPEVEISRRIVRGAGSTYRINGHEVRARDVQLLFADLATGAHSTAMVSQGRVGALIQAKPAQRRGLLDEAAGITGLHSRRHEAELRLHGAETNLERLEDVLQALGDQLRGLKRQAAQARRYRRLSQFIRRQDAILLHLQWGEASAAVEAAAARLVQAEEQVTARKRTAAAAATDQAEGAAALPPLRDAEVAAAAELQRFLVAAHELEAEEARLARAREENHRRREQIRGDQERERALAADAQEALRQTEAQRAALDAETRNGAESEPAAKVDIEAAETTLRQLEGWLTERTEQVAAVAARGDDLGRQIEALTERAARLGERRAEIDEERRRLDAADNAPGPSAAPAERRLDKARAAAERAEPAAEAARADEERAREALRPVAAEWAELAAEESVLASLLAADDRGSWTPIIDEIAVDPGFEAALGAALGDDLTGSTEPAAPAHWKTLDRLDRPPALPPEAESLADHVRAPAALSRRLSQIGVVADRAQGRALQARLKPGQRLVTRDGALWRWDGFAVETEPEAGAAARLGQRNRLVELRARLEAMSKQREAVAKQVEAASEAAAKAIRAAQAAREALAEAYAQRDKTRDEQAVRQREAIAARSRREALDEVAARLEADLAEAGEGLEDARRVLAAHPDVAAARKEIDSLQAEVAAARARLVEASSAYDLLVRAAVDHKRRRNAIDDDARSWRDRAASAEAHLATLEDRLQAALAEDQALAARPAQIVAQRQQVNDRLEAAEAARGRAADRLAEAETVQANADRRLRHAESELADTREQRVRLQAGVAQTEQARQTVADRIGERLECGPAELPELAGLSEDEQRPEVDAVEAKLARLSRERETMGPVNLRAEEESDLLAEQLATMGSERDDLIAAIGRLRQAIVVLNREGRQRLLASFASVNEHFERLFVQLFGGGRAHLELTGGEDPLDAGLEIMASPPGKRLQTLSLLSGGEQALTATALMFAVFLTNPAPICVLDEVDAALDDANVDRFCTLLETIARTTETRFLVITHHRMTMARMDRLFGVTMVDRGISRMVSVDLQQAERLKATA